jgi:hypothetical protein
MTITPKQYAYHERAVRNAVFNVKTTHAGIGWLVQPFGQGTFDEDVRKALRNRESAARHLPDLLLTHAATGHTCFVECKTESTRNLTSGNFSIERRSLLTCLQLNQSTPTVVVFADMRCVSVTEIVDLFRRQEEATELTSTKGIRISIARGDDIRLGPETTFGSNDPYYLIRRDALPNRTIAEYLDELISDETIYGREVIDDPFRWCL